MEHTLLVGFLEGNVAPEQFGEDVAEEVAACNQAFRSGKVGYINITDGPSFIVTRDHAKRLLEAILEERLGFELANYTADCIIMSDAFELADDVVKEAIFFVEDDSVPPTVEEVQIAIQRLAG